MRRLLLPALLVLAVGCEKPPAPSATGTEAQRLLAEAGFPGGKDFPKLQILYNSNESHKKIAAAVQEMWRKNLGIEVDLVNKEWKVYLDHLTRVDYQVARRGWVADYPDPNTFLDLFLTQSGNNNTGWSHAEYDKLIDEASRIADPPARMAVLQKAEAILMDELPVIPIYFYVTQCLWRAETQGLFDNALNIHPLKGVKHQDGNGTFVMNVGAEPQTLDNNIARGVTEHRVTISLFEGLTTSHPKTLEAQPGMAESWTTSPDGKTWTFKLRDAKWSDGRPVTAGDFVYSWRRQIDPAIASDYAYIVFGYLKNGKAYYDGATADLALKGFATLDDAKRLETARGLPGQAQTRHAAVLKDLAGAEKNAEIKKLLEEAAANAGTRKDVLAADLGVRAADDRTLVVDLESSTPYFLHLTSFFSFGVVPSWAIEKHGDKWTRPEHIVSNGPYRLKEWVPNSHILVERNPGYWDAANVPQKLVKFIPQDNVTTAFTMFNARQCDYIDTVPPEFVDKLKGTPEFHSIPYLSTYFYSFNVKIPPLKDKRVRRALALAIDRQIITDKILKGGQQPSFNMVPPSLAGYSSQPFQKK